MPRRGRGGHLIDGARVFVVVPALDEAAWIARTLATMPAFVDRVLVVDDASRDGTAATARAAPCPAPVEVILHEENRGVGAAIATGYKRALACGADVIAVMAGDAQMDPADLARVVEPVCRGRADYVKGNRLRHAQWRAMPRARLVGTLLLSALTSWAIGRRVGDSQCGYTAIGREKCARLDLDRLWPRFGYPNDLLAAVARAGGRIEEVVVRPVYAGQKSGLKPRHVAAMLWLIARARWRRGA